MHGNIGFSKKVKKGLIWSFLETFAAYVVRFIFSVLIARILCPQDYGLVAIMTIFILISSRICEGGFMSAIVQQKYTNKIQISTIFYINLFTSVFLYIILFFSAGYVSDFFNQPELSNIIRISSISIILGAINAAQIALLIKELQFRKLAIIRIFSAITSGLVGLIMAILGYGYWALIAQTMAGTILGTIFTWLWSSWRPTLVFKFKAIRQLFKYGFMIFLQDLSEIVFSKAYFPLIGKLYSTSQLGYFSSASSYNELIIKQSNLAITKVLFPTFSSIQDEREKVVLNYKKVFIILTMTNFFLVLYTYLIIGGFVTFFLTFKWSAIITLIKIMIIEGLFYSNYTLNYNVINALGDSKTSFIIDSVKKIFILISILICFKLGITSLIIGYLISSFISLLISMYAIRKKLRINYGFILTDLFKIVVIVGIHLIVFLYVDFDSLFYMYMIKVVVIPITLLVMAYVFRMDAMKIIAEILNLKRIIIFNK